MYLQMERLKCEEGYKLKETPQFWWQITGKKCYWGECKQRQILLSKICFFTVSPSVDLCNAFKCIALNSCCILWFLHSFYSTWNSLVKYECERCTSTVNTTKDVILHRNLTFIVSNLCQPRSSFIGYTKIQTFAVQNNLTQLFQLI